MNSFPLISGVALGFTGSLHCAAMCGGVTCGSMLLLGAKTPRELLNQLLLLQSGRIACYAIVGAALAAAGSSVVNLTSAAGFVFLRSAGVASILWMALSAAGYLPRVTVFDQGAALLSSMAFRGAASVRSAPPAIYALALGGAWGLNACPMMYAAAFSATLTGDIVSGANFMAGFGLGTTPALLAAYVSLNVLSSTRARRWSRYVAPVILSAVAIATALAPIASGTVICFSSLLD